GQRWPRSPSRGRLHFTTSRKLWIESTTKSPGTTSGGSVTFSVPVSPLFIASRAKHGAIVPTPSEVVIASPALSFRDWSAGVACDTLALTSHGVVGPVDHPENGISTVSPGLPEYHSDGTLTFS